jgi:hypothetical protein
MPKEKKNPKYRHENQHWSKFCTMRKCDEETVFCHLGYPGHYAYWIQSDSYKVEENRKLYKVIQLIAHAHFVEDKDAGRHCECREGSHYIDEKYTKTIVVLDNDKRKLPGHVRDLLED